MSDPRRFTNDETSAIIERAIIAQDQAQNPTVQASGGVQSSGSMAPASGLTLEQLQAIGAEVGVAPDFIARAARDIARGATAPTRIRRWLGLPMGVARTVDLGRVVSDAEWDRIVVQLRTTFDARGRTDLQGGLRAWSNGNLQVLLEPTPQGHRMHLMTMKGNARALMTVSGLFVGAGAWLASLAMLPTNGDFRVPLLTGGSVALMGVITFAATALGLPRWAKTRAHQMEAIGAGLIDAQDP